MKKKPVAIRTFSFYPEEVQTMILGKTLGLIILIKLFSMFFIPRIEKQEYGLTKLIGRAINP